MQARSRECLIVVLLLVGLSANPLAASASKYWYGWSGFMHQKAVFTYAMHPGFPLERYAEGRLGILQPTYARSYLYVAYRHMIGVGFDRKERRALVRFWSERLNTQDEFESPGRLRDGETAWTTARAKVLNIGASPKIDSYRPVPSDSAGGHHYYLNCPDDAFLTAARTLAERISRFGAGSLEVRDWVQAQDRVFANCGGGQHIPDPPSPRIHPLIVADRAYQIAAAHFYAENFDVAAKMFREIGKDPASPWRTIAPYLAARALLRKGVVRAVHLPPDAVALAAAESQLLEVLADPSRGAIHGAARASLNLVRLRLGTRFHELSPALLKKGSGKTLKQDLLDYVVQLDGFQHRDLTSLNRAGDLTDWILTIQNSSPAAPDHALDRWSRTSSLPWLVASLAKAPASHPILPELLVAAEKVRRDSPAFATVAFHAIRLLIASNRSDEARRRLDAILSQGPVAFPPPARNLFLSQRMLVARDLEELLRYAPRVPASPTLFQGEDDLELPPTRDVYLRARGGIFGRPLRPSVAGQVMLDADFTKVVNEWLPLPLLKEAAVSGALPVHLRREVALAAWTRAVLLDNDRTAAELVPVLEGLAPEVKTYLESYRMARTAQARRFAAVHLMLKFPGAQPYVRPGLGRLTTWDRIAWGSLNWWCPWEPGAELPYRTDVEVESRLSRPLRMLYPDGRVPPPVFLDVSQRRAAQDELRRIQSIGPAANYLGRHTLEWARANPNDPRVPEALHLAVRSTRWGCESNKETGKLSWQAFRLLHRRYPNSEWAEKTKYWYGTP